MTLNPLAAFFPNVRFIAYAEPTDDGLAFSAVDAWGRVIVADTPLLLAQALLDAKPPRPRPVRHAPSLALAA